MSIFTEDSVTNMEKSQYISINNLECTQSGVYIYIDKKKYVSLRIYIYVHRDIHICT